MVKQKVVPIKNGQPYELKRDGIYLFEVKEWAMTRKEARYATAYYRQNYSIDLQFIFTTGEGWGLKAIPPIKKRTTTKPTNSNTGEDELQKILEKLVHTRENYEMLPEYDTAVDEAKAAISAYTTNKIIEAKMQATLNTAERIKVSFLEHRARTPVQEWKTLEEIIEREKLDILTELKALNHRKDN